MKILAAKKMIATVKAPRSPKASSMSALVDYLADKKGHEGRVEENWVANCVSEASDLELLKLEIQNTNSKNERAEGARAYHLIISFKEDERPDIETLKDITRNYAEVLGYGEHHYVCVAHGDTDNFHVHMAILKIHPENFNCPTPLNDYDKLAAMSTELEIKHGLGRDNHTAQNNVGVAVAKAMERAGGQESLIGYIKRSCAEKILKSSTWAELHSVLADNDIVLAKRGNGLIFKSISTGITCKISSIDRDFSLGKFTAQFGSFEEVSNVESTPKRQYNKAPLGAVANNDLYAAYKETQTQRQKAISILRAENTRKKNAEINAIKKRYDKKIDSIISDLKSVFLPGRYKVSLYQNLAEIRKEKAEKIKKIKAKYSKIGKDITKSTPQIKWLDWLAEKAINGDEAAILFLAGRKAKSSQNREQSLSGDSSKSAFVNRLKLFVSKKGTIFHSAGLRETKESVFFRNATDDEIAKGLEMAINRFGTLITAQGNDAFKRRLARVVVVNGLSCSFSDETTQSFKTRLESKLGQVGKEKARQKENEKERMRQDAMTYIQARNEARLKVKDIKEHVFHESKQNIPAGVFRGVRNSSTSKLVLIETGNVINVVPYSAYGAKRIEESGIKIGQTIQLAQGRVSLPKGIERVNCGQGPSETKKER